MNGASRALVWIAILAGAGIFGLPGVMVLLSGVKDVWRAMASSSWPRVPAEVVRSEVEAERPRDSDGATNTTYSARLLFAYEVDGQNYTTERVRFGEALGTGDPSEPEMQRLRYPLGARVSVVYDPEHPEVAAARTGFHPVALVKGAAGVGLLLAAALILVGAIFATSDSERVFPLLLRLFVLLFVLIGISMSAAGAFNLMDAWRSTKWPVANGEIVFQKGDEIQSRWEDSDGRTRQATSYATSVVYSFAVDGAVHYANARRFGQLAGGGGKWAAAIANRYPMGAAVKVWYHPVDPDRAVLEPGLSSEVWWLPGAGLAFLLFGVAVWVWGIPALTEGF
jgi:hypothetical protein